MNCSKQNLLNWLDRENLDTPLQAVKVSKTDYGVLINYATQVSATPSNPRYASFAFYYYLQNFGGLRKPNRLRFTFHPSLPISREDLKQISVERTEVWILFEWIGRGRIEALKRELFQDK